MTRKPVPRWQSKRTNESKQVEKVLKDAGFETVDAYRYNSASIRVRVIDSQFEGLKIEKRDAMVEPYLEQLPERIQADIISLFTFAPSELDQAPITARELLLNTEFDNPSPSML